MSVCIVHGAPPAWGTNPGPTATIVLSKTGPAGRQLTGLHNVDAFLLCVLDLTTLPPVALASGYSE